MRRRLVALAAAITWMVALAFLVPLALLVRDLARDRALTAAELEAQSLAPVLALTSDPSALRPAVEATRAGAAGRLTVFLADGRTVGARAVRGDAYRLARRGRTFSAEVAGGVEVLVPVVLPADNTAVIRVLVPSSTLRRGVTGAWVALAGLSLALVGLAVVVADRMARSVVAPVEALGRAAHRLGQGDLDARVEPGGPAEIAEMARAFNRLVARVRELLAAERETVADLSHRLRTPLTALRLDAESVPDPADRRRLAEGVAEVEQAVNRVIESARRPVRDGIGATTDVAALVRDRLAFWAPLAEEQGRAWSVDAADGTGAPVPVAVHPDDLEAALDALLGNVFAHTPEGTAFRVGVDAAGGDGAVLVVVEDDGPGFAADQAVARGNSGAGSTGLGLDIARRTAEAAGGSLRLATGAGGGARVEVRLPPEPA